MKQTKRKGFNFFRSYYDVYNELETDKDKVAFINALLDRQFLGVKPTNLKGMAKFAYISQTNSIDSQVKGYEDKTGEVLIFTPSQPPPVPPADGGGVPPPVQVQEKEKVQDVDTSTPKGAILDKWIQYRKEIKKPLKQVTIDNLIKDFESKSDACVTFVINSSISNGWQGLFWDKYIEPQPEYKSPHQKEYEHIMKEVNAENERQRLLKLENDTN